jgi:hypothetical protein
MGVDHSRDRAYKGSNGTSRHAEVGEVEKDLDALGKTAVREVSG